MKVTASVFLIIFSILFIFHPPLAKTDDPSCLLSILSQIYGLPTVSICGSSNNTNVYYKSSCINDKIDSLYIQSFESSITTYLTYNHLNCFSNVFSQLTLIGVYIDSNNPFGYSNDTIVSKKITLTECKFSDGEFPLVTAGKSLPMLTERLDITINQLSNLKKVRFSSLKYVKYFNFYLTAGMNSNFAEFVNELQDQSYEFKVWSIQTNNVPSFLNTRISTLYLGIVDSTSTTAQTSFGNLDSLNMIGELHFIFDDPINFPSQLSSPNNNFEMLNMVGVLTANNGEYVSLPSSIKRYQQIVDSPNFNINGVIPFISFPESVYSIVIRGMGITTFPTNLPSNLIILELSDNIFSTELPDLSKYSLLSNVKFENSGFYGEIKDSYCNYNIQLNDNNLNGTLPQCKICYINQFLNYFNGNPSLSFGTCNSDSVVPNTLKYDSGLNKIYLTGSNLGIFLPTVYLENYTPKFTIVTKQESFSLDWDRSYGSVPKYLLIGIGSRNFTLSVGYSEPEVNNATKSAWDQFTINGSGFSYNKSEFEVVISGFKGTIFYIDYNSIIVSFTANPLPPLVNALGTVKSIGGYSATFNVDTSVLFPILCSYDCGESQGQGSCNTTMGVCMCNQKWTGHVCNIPNQYLTSASSTLTTGGIVNLYGWFGSLNVDLSIKIGDLNCTLQTYNETFANCSIGAGSGTKSITIYQNGRTWIGNNMFHYTELTYNCPKDCSLNGIQNGECNKSTGQCKCFTNWGGFDCNSIKTETSSSTTTTSGGNQTPAPTVEIPKSNTTIDDLSGSTIITNQQTSYEISILSLVELDILDNIVLEYNLTNKWIYNNPASELNNNIHLFTQNITELCSIIYKVEDIKEPRDFEFAGLELSLDKDTIKITVTINNYPFKSILNKLQLRIESSVGDSEETKSNNQCNNKDTQIDSSQIDQNQLLNYIVISKNEKVLYGRFLNRVLSDTRESFITTRLISNSTITADNNNNNNKQQSFIIGLDLPFFSQSLVIDPDFSVLVSSSYKKCNDNTSNGDSWVLPVAIVIPCVTVAAIIIVISIIIKKNRTAVLMVKLKLKSLSRKN